MTHHSDVFTRILTTKSTIPTTSLIEPIHIPQSYGVPRAEPVIQRGKLAKQVGRRGRVKRDDVPVVQVVRPTR